MIVLDNFYHQYVDNILNISKEDIFEYLKELLPGYEPCEYDYYTPPEYEFSLLCINTKTLEMHHRNNLISSVEDLNYSLLFYFGWDSTDDLESISKIVHKELKEYQESYTKNLLNNNNDNYQFIYGTLTEEEKEKSIIDIMSFVRPSIFKLESHKFKNFSIEKFLKDTRRGISDNNEWIIK